MREIKFRTWGEKRRHYLGNWEYVIDPDGRGVLEQVGYDPEYEKFRLNHETTLEQYTGIHDKNGKEIYEGDIVKCTAHGSNNVFVMQVAYSDVWAMFYVYSDSHKPRGLAVAYHDFEVIGNIHENKELLEKKK